MAGTPSFSRAQVLAHRAYLQGLSGATAPAGLEVLGLDVLALGLQDSPAGSAALGLRARAGDAARVAAPKLVLALTARGSPHLHRRSDLPVLRSALPPASDDEVLGRFGGLGAVVVGSGVDVIALADEVAARMREVFPGDTATKGELSAALTPHVPPVAAHWCEGCRATHVIEGLFRLATLLAGVELVPHEGRRLLFRLSPDEPVRAAGGRRALFREFVRLAGPLVRDDLAGWLDARTATGAPRWHHADWSALAGELVAVRVDGRELSMLAEDLDGVGSAPEPPRLRLLPPRDALLLGHRPLLVPEPAAARQVWRAIGSPGVLLIDGELAGTWRQRIRGSRLEITVEPFAGLPTDLHAALDAEGAAVAALRGARDVRVQRPP